MKKLLVLFTVILCLVPLVIGSSCSSVGNFRADFLKIVPTDLNSYVIMFNVKSVRNDSDLSSVYTQMGGLLSTSGQYGFNLDNIDYLGGAEGSSGSLLLWKGTINQKDVVAKLDSLGYYTDTYNGIDLRTSQDGSFTVAFLPIGFVVGTSKDLVEGSIRSSKGIDESFYTDVAHKELINKTRQGLIVEMSFDESIQSQWEGATGTALTLDKMNTTEFTVQGIIQFTNDSNAKNSLSNIKDNLAVNVVVSKVTQNGNSVVVEGSSPMNSYDFSRGLQ